MSVFNVIFFHFLRTPPYVWYCAGVAIARSRVWTPSVWLCTTNAYQRIIFRGRFTTRESCGVNGHTTRWSWYPYPWSRAFVWCPAEGYRKRRSAPPHEPLRLGKIFTLLLFLVYDALLCMAQTRSYYYRLQYAVKRCLSWRDAVFCPNG